MLQPSADSTGYWWVWGLVLTGKWWRKPDFQGGVRCFGEESSVIGEKKGRNGVLMAVDVMGIGGLFVLYPDL